ncbi:MAG TPA: polysaccharide deacetylase family protein [Verrucomicrobiae bacterium]|nr:polysaccharide deacetylase family protein [Verrucomicrobiae bacterium]
MDVIVPLASTRAVTPRARLPTILTGLHITLGTGQTACVLGLPDNLVFLGRAQKNLMARGAAVFTYHKIGAPPKNCRDPFLYVKVEELDRQLTALREIGFRPAHLGGISSPGNSLAGNFVITFDDGFLNVLDLGLELLARHQIPAIQFIVSDFVGKQNEWDIAKGDSAEPLMDAAQIKQWLAAGHEIGSHSATHRNLRQLNAAEAREEICGSKKALEDKFGVEIRHFCYPFGGWTPAARDLVAQAGYQTACTVEFGVVEAKADPFTLRRIIPLSRADLTRKIVHRLAGKIGL